MSRRFRITPGTAGSAPWKQTITIPEATSCPLKMVEVFCGDVVLPEDQLHVFCILGAQESDAILWTLNAPTGGFVVGDLTNTAVFMIGSNGSGTVSATVNGKPIGALSYANCS